ncbi:MAG: hypothetical protein K2Y04_08480 [Caulobacteraceae bacterium]|nr:hypothetical protein [Caulobacteraceae bacterium]
MITAHRLISVVALGAVAFATAACTPADNTADRATETTIVETREVPAAPIVIEREVAVPSPPVVIESDRREGDTTTVRAGSNGLEVETTNR